MEEVNLSFARFNRNDLASVRLRNAIISFYFVSGPNIPKKASSDATQVYEAVHSLGNGELLISYGLQISDIDQVSKLKADLAKSVRSAVAVYDDEYASLLSGLGYSEYVSF